MKYVGIHLTKHVWDLYAKNYKMLIEKSKKIKVNRETYHFQELEDSTYA